MGYVHLEIPGFPVGEQQVACREVSDTMGCLDLKFWLQDLSQQKHHCGRIASDEGSCRVKRVFC